MQLAVGISPRVPVGIVSKILSSFGMICPPLKYVTIFICNNLQNKQGYYRKSRFLLFENPYIHLIKKLNHCIVTANAGKSPLRVNISNLLKAQVG